jgi:succinate dehydrogenase/fumarate reductase-like Fe-S protein
LYSLIIFGGICYSADDRGRTVYGLDGAATVIGAVTYLVIKNSPEDNSRIQKLKGDKKVKLCSLLYCKKIRHCPAVIAALQYVSTSGMNEQALFMAMHLPNMAVP